MRTTLELDESLLRAAERYASEQGQPLAAFIDDAVREYLAISPRGATSTVEEAADQSRSGDADDAMDALVKRNKGKGRAAAIELAESKRPVGGSAEAAGGRRPRLSYAGIIDDDADLSLRVEEVLAASWPKG